jgi:hypothetical protein
MVEPGLDKHDWESEMAVLEDELSESPADALPELDELVGRMLVETGFDLGDPVELEGDEREVVSEFLAAREIMRALERGSDEISPGDVAAAVNGYRNVFDFVVSERTSSQEP